MLESYWGGGFFSVPLEKAFGQKNVISTVNVSWFHESVSRLKGT